MKNIFRSSILILSGILIFFACEDPDAIRFPEFEEAANVRIQVDEDYQSLKADDLANAKLVFSVFSENTNIESVVLSGTYYDFYTDSLYEKAVVRSWTQADFNSNNGAIRNVELTSDELAQLFGKSSGTDLSGGDRFDFFNLTTLTNGMVFPDTIDLPTGEVVNVTPNIINSAATTSFSVGFQAYVACPTALTFGIGDYLLEQIAGPDDPFFGMPTRFATEVVTITALNPIQRSFLCTYLTFDEVEFNWLLICGNNIIADDSGISCGTGLFWGTPGTPSTYDVNDDSEFILEIAENVAGDCGLPVAEPLTLRLTKIQ